MSLDCAAVQPFRPAFAAGANSPREYRDGNSETQLTAMQPSLQAGSCGDDHGADGPPNLRCAV